jgi:hypothetical protein
MKTNKFMVLLAIWMFFPIVNPAVAFPVRGFPGWNILTEKSSDIIILRCNATPDPFNIWKDGHQVDFQGLFDSEMQITYVLKGATNSGVTRLSSEYSPRQGEYYLVLGNYYNGSYQAYERYRIVSLGTHFSTNSLSKKTFDEQIQMLLERRLNELSRKMKEEQEEKQRLEGGIKR